jgi:DNA-binding MarR family transcriptional regulator
MNDELLTRLVADGWPRLTRNQSLLFANLQPEGITASELARQIGITRQSMQKLIESLLGESLVELTEHPDDARSHLVGLAPRGSQLMLEARKHLLDIERRLQRHLGSDAINQFRRYLFEDWTTLM